jgi:hypothetical protein
MVWETNIFQNCDGLAYCMASWLNDLTFSSFWTFFLISLSVILFMSTYRYGSIRAFIYSMFGGFVGALFLWQIGLVPLATFIMFAIVLIIALAFTILGNER